MERPRRLPGTNPAFPLLAETAVTAGAAAQAVPGEQVPARQAQPAQQHQQSQQSQPAEEMPDSFQAIDEDVPF